MARKNRLGRKKDFTVEEMNRRMFGEPTLKHYTRSTYKRTIGKVRSYAESTFERTVGKTEKAMIKGRG